MNGRRIKSTVFNGGSRGVSCTVTQVLGKELGAFCLSAILQRYIQTLQLKEAIISLLTCRACFDYQASIQTSMEY